MNTYIAELLDTETDEVIETFTFEAASEEEAYAKAEDEAEYQGFFAGSVRKISG